MCWAGKEVDADESEFLPQRVLIGTWSMLGPYPFTEVQTCTTGLASPAASSKRPRP